jgi:hypothetical protein
MADLTVNKIYGTKSRGGYAAYEAYQVTDAYAIKAGALVTVLASGRAGTFADLATTKFKGVAIRAVTGATGATPIPEVEVDCSGLTLEKVTVATVASIADVHKLVFMTDNQTMTLTPATNMKAIGTITRWYSSTTCDVKLFTPQEHDALY